MKRIAFFLLFFPLFVRSQQIEKVVFDVADSTNGYYLAVRPFQGVIKGAVVVFTAFRGPESILPETKLHNVAAANDLLTVYASVGVRISPGAAGMDRMNKLFMNVMRRYKVDSAHFAVGGFDVAGMAVLRYAELAREHPEQYAVRPRAVFGIDAPVDLGGLRQFCERVVRKNYPSPSLGDAQAMIGLMDREQAGVQEWTPFDRSLGGPGHEQFLRNVAVRLYYETDIEWQLRTRRNSYYETYLPDGSELVDRLLLQGNSRAEFVSAKQPGMRSNGNRSASAFSIVDEVDCIQWIIQGLRPYSFPVPEGWRAEQYPLPAPFSPNVTLHGLEDLRLTPGWGISGAPDYWSASALYWLNAGQKIDEAALQENLQAYYDGLAKLGAGAAKQSNPADKTVTTPTDKMVPTKVQLKPVKTEAGDVTTYEGTIDMLDFLAMKPMRLNLMVHVVKCDNPNYIPVILQFSPKPYGDDIWYQLRELKKRFTCGE